MYISQQATDAASLSPVSKVKKLKATYDLLMHDTTFLIKKKKYKKTYQTLERFMWTVNTIDFLNGKEKLKMNFRIFYVLEKMLKNKLIKKDAFKGQSIQDIESINIRMTEAFIQFNDIYSSILREEQLRNTLDSNKQLITLINHEDAISKLFCMISQIYINNYFIESLRGEVFLAIKYLTEAKEFIKTVYTLNVRIFLLFGNMNPRQIHLLIIKIRLLIFNKCSIFILIKIILNKNYQNSHLLEKDIYVTTLLGNFYTENGLHKKAIEIFQQGIKSIIMVLRYRYIEPNPPLETEEEEDEKNVWKQRRFQRSVKMIISFLYSLAYTYEKIWKIEHAFEALQLARYLGKHVLFDNSDEFKRYLIHIEHELDSRYSKIVQETLEIEQITSKELQKNQRWYQMAEMLKEEKQKEKQTKNMYDEDLYQKNNVKKLNQSKTITIKKKEEDSFKSFLSTISLKQSASKSDRVVRSRSRGGSCDKIQTVFKRDRSMTQNSQSIYENNQNDRKFSTPFSKFKAESDDRTPTPVYLQMQRINEKRNNQNSQRNYENQIQRNKAPLQSYSTRDGSINRTYSKSIFSGINNNNKNEICPRLRKNNHSFSNNNVNNNSNKSLLNITNILNSYNNKSSENINNIQNQNNNCSDNNEDKQSLKNSQDMTDQEIINTNQNGGMLVDIDQNQEKSPSDLKKLQSSQSLTHNNSGIQNNNTHLPINAVDADQNSNDSYYHIQSVQKSNGGDSVNSFRSARKYQAVPSIFGNKSGFRFGTPQRKISSSGQNSKSSYHINYGRMSIRINDIENPENFGALTNLLLNHNLEKLEEDPNAKEGNSNFMFDSPSSSSSSDSPKQNRRVSKQQHSHETKQFRSKTQNTITSSSIPFNSSSKTGDDKFSQQNGGNQKIGKSQSEAKLKQFDQQKIIFGQSSEMTNFDTQNIDKQNKDVTNLDYYLSQHIYKALQKSFISKAYSK